MSPYGPWGSVQTQSCRERRLRAIMNRLLLPPWLALAIGVGLTLLLHVPRGLSAVRNTEVLLALGLAVYATVV
jgi:hypothetical protein